MARQSLVSMVSDDLLNRIVSSEFPPGYTLPGELELAAKHDVSRMTVREAIKTLEAQGVVRVERGRGTYVNELQHWSSMEAVLRSAAEGEDDAGAAVQLIALRRMLETGAAELAATRITAGELDSMRDHVTAMSEAHEANDVGRFVEADLAFHDLILHASGNVFVAVLFVPLSHVLSARRAQTSKVVQIQANALREHKKILQALGSGDPERARLAMDSHMTQTMNDLKTHILHI
jgi:GntR family transcriptional repressor for pyruvate dehydrogenase complex